MERKSIQPFYGIITLGLEKGYEKVKIEESDVVQCIQEHQDNLITNKKIYLSASISNCSIVLSGQIEPHLSIRFINYPKFELEPPVLKLEIEELAKKLMTTFQQNRIVIEYMDELIMLEESSEIDPRIINSQ